MLFKSELEITEDALDELAERAMQGKTGARALNSILHEVIWEAKYNLPGSNIGIGISI
jgi:ATP-dependent protease Clp ATPase subunit